MAVRVDGQDQMASADRNAASPRGTVDGAHARDARRCSPSDQLPDGPAPSQLEEEQEDREREPKSGSFASIP